MCIYFLVSAAYEMARKVAAQGIEMLPADRWESQHNLAFQLYLGTTHANPSPIPNHCRTD